MRLPSFRPPSLNRSQNMSAIRSSGNRTTEGRLASLLSAYHLKGWQLHPAEICGKPDVVIRSKRIAIFADGCFWHGCPSCGHIPRTNRAYWRAKLVRNKRRDKAVSASLRAAGFRVIRLWECQLRANPKRCLMKIQVAMRSDLKD